jgi:elongation factor 2
LLDPTLGTVAFASGKECWGFRLQDFARFYAAKYKWDEAKLTQRLWGDNFYDTVAKRWRCESVGENGQQLKRGFV